MKTKVLAIVETLRDDEAVALMGGVKQDLESGDADAALARLSPEEAREFLDVLALTAKQSEHISNATAAGDAARIFLANLAEFPALQPIIVARFAEGGVRLSLVDVLARAKDAFNLAGLLGLKFSYEGETIEIQEIDGRKIEKRRKISLAVGG